MAKFLGKFDIASFDQLTGSAAFNTRRRLIKNKQRVPFNLVRGNQSKGFKKADITPTSTNAPVIVKIDEKFNYVALTKSAYQARLERQLQSAISGASAARGQDIPASIYNTIRAQVISKLNQVPSVVMLLSEDVPFSSGSYNITSGSKLAYSGIANASGHFDRTFNNFSPTATGATWSFSHATSQLPTSHDGVNGNEIHQSDYTSSFIIRTFASGSTSGSFLGQPSNYFVHQKRPVDAGKFHNYKFHVASSSKTGSVEKVSTAGFYRTILKANIFGDGNETQFNANFAEPTSAFYATDRELITFPYDTKVASGGFWMSDRFESLVGVMAPSAKGFQPIRRVTLYWASGSGGLVLSGSLGAGLSGSITPNQILPDSDTISGITSGSHIFLDSRLQQPASGGYYTTARLNHYPNNPHAAVNPNSHGIYWTASIDLIRGGVPVGSVIHIAGNGINDNSLEGSKIFANPFQNAHDSTGSAILRAAVQWNGQSFSSGASVGDINPGDYDDTGDN